MSLVYVYLEDPLVTEIAKTYICDKETHDANAREWTRRYAMLHQRAQNTNSKQ